MGHGDEDSVGDKEVAILYISFSGFIAHVLVVLCRFNFNLLFIVAKVVVLATLVPVFAAAHRLEELGVLAAVGLPVDAFVESMARNAILVLLTARIHLDGALFTSAERGELLA